MVQDLGVLAQRRDQQFLGHHEQLVAGARHDVDGIGGDSSRGVGHQRPRRRCPDEQRDAGEPLRELTVEHLASDEDRRVDDGFVALGQLMVAQGRAASRAVGGDAVILLQQTLVEDRLQRPPDAVDVVRRHRPIRVVHVDPVAHARGHVREGVHVPQHGLAAFLVELCDPVSLNVRFTVKPELFLDRELHGQPVTVPSGLTRDVIPLHRAVAREQVLEHAGLDVVNAGSSVRGGRPFEEGPLRVSLGLLE